MQDNYIKELLSCLEETRISLKGMTCELCLEEGIQELLRQFTNHKRKASQCFLSVMVEALQLPVT